MTRDEVRDAIRREWRQFGEPDRKGKGIICPICDNGSGSDGDGLSEKPGTGKLHCFKCGWSGDAVDLIRHANGCDYLAALEIGADALGLELDGHTAAPTARKQPTPKPVEKAAESLPDFTGDYKRWAAALPGSDGEAYLHARGISLETAQRFGVGYAADWRCPGVSESVPTSPRLIYPSTRHGYKTRDIRPTEEIPESSQRFTKQGKGPVEMFGAAELKQSEPVHVVEGQMDALSIAEVGGHAVATCSTSGVNRLDERLERMKRAGETIPPLILSLDMDANNAGQDAQNALKSKLDRQGIFSTEGTLYGKDGAIKGVKDANEALLKDRAKFAAAVADDIERAKAARATWTPPKAAETFDSEAEQAAAADAAERLRRVTDSRFNLGAFLDGIKAGNNTRVSTGIGALDERLGGGMYPGVIMLGARTGIGKTTLALQIGDSIASGGHPVLYVALEMDRDELAAKSIARIHNAASDHTITFGSILDGTANGAAVEKAAEQYAAWASKYLHVMDVMDGVTVNGIIRMARDIAAETGTAPLVIVDYLQFLRAADSRMSAKDAADANAAALKQLNKQLRKPVIAVSSFNRASYSERVKDGGQTRERNEDEWFDALESAFKESGGIEYTADVMLALRPIRFNGPQIDERLYVVKNRRGPRHVSMNMTLHGDRGLFTMQDEEPYTGPIPFETEARLRTRRRF